MTIAGILIYNSSKKKALYENSNNNNHLPKNGGTQQVKNGENNFPKNGGAHVNSEDNNQQNGGFNNGNVQNGGIHNGGIYAKSSAVTKTEVQSALREFISFLLFCLGFIVLIGAIYTLTLIGKYAHGYVWTWQFSLIAIALSLASIIAGVRFSPKKKQIMDLLFGKDE